MSSSLLDGRKYRWFHECEADCPAMAKDLIPFHGEAFQFCKHHADKIAKQLVEQQSRYAVVGPTRAEL